MEPFVEILFAFPTVIPSVLFGLVLLYWLLVVIGTLDIDIIDFDADPLDSVAEDPGFFPILGLTGVPATVAASILVLWSWLLTALATELLKHFISGGVWYVVLGLVVLLLSVLVAVLISALSVRPLRRFFQTPEARRIDTLVGGTCVVTTQWVDEDFGQAEFSDGGAGLLIQIRAGLDNGLTRGSRALIVEREGSDNVFRVRVYGDDPSISG